jgi:uncharacterized Fe-S cluster protein YjdI
LREIIKKYSNGEVTVVWQPSICIHSAICFRGMPEVFDPNERPWIKVENGNTNDIIEQIKKCPSGAISYTKNNMENIANEKSEISETKVKVNLNGPLLVSGNLSIAHFTGETIKKENNTAFCRCGYSKNKPFCDGAHKSIAPFDL